MALFLCVSWKEEIGRELEHLIVSGMRYVFPGMYKQQIERRPVKYIVLH